MVNARLNFFDASLPRFRAIFRYETTAESRTGSPPGVSFVVLRLRVPRHVRAQSPCNTVDMAPHLVRCRFPCYSRLRQALVRQVRFAAEVIAPSASVGRSSATSSWFWPDEAWRDAAGQRSAPALPVVGPKAGQRHREPCSSSRISQDAAQFHRAIFTTLFAYSVFGRLCFRIVTVQGRRQLSPYAPDSRQAPLAAPQK